MRVGTSYKQHPIHGSYDAIVVGSGIGGLTTAAFLARHGGKRVLVLERHYTAGGFTHSFQRPGYEWDVGVHYIGEIAQGGLLGRVLDHVSDGAIEWADLGDVIDRIVVGGESYDVVRGRRRLREVLCARFPDETRAIDGYFDALRETIRGVRGYFAEKAMPRMLSAVAGPLLRRTLQRRSRQTVHDVLQSLGASERLRTVLAGQWGDYGLPPREGSFAVHAMVATHYFAGGYYPVGGAARIAAGIVPVIEGAGGKVVTNATVERILVQNGRAAGVRLADGNELCAPIVVSNAGAPLTVRRLLEPADAARTGLDAVIRRLRPSAGHVSLYVGLRATAAELGLPRYNLWVYPGDDHDRNVARYTADPSAPLPVAFLSFPSARDPEFTANHPGRATIEVLTLSGFERYARWADTRWKKRGEDYETHKAELSDRLLAELYRHVPQARGHVEIAELSTPLTTRWFAAHERGEIYGLACTPQRFEEPLLRPHTRIPGLYLTGADVCAPGVGGATMGGVLCASAILGPRMLRALAELRRSVAKVRPPAASAPATARAVAA